MPARTLLLWWMSFGSVEGIVTLSDVTETIAVTYRTKWKRTTPAMIFRRMRTVPGRRMVICRWKIWCNMCRCRWMKNVEYSHHCRAVDGIFTAYSKTWRRSSGGGLFGLKRCRWKAIACRRCRLFRCIRMASWSTRCDGIGHFTR